jgi:hypothetical protein
MPPPSSNPRLPCLSPLPLCRPAPGALPLQLVGETFPWGPASTFAYLNVNHNSVLGIRRVPG